MNKSQISWTDTTWSPVTGCTKVSQGCKHCYAEREVTQRWSKNPKSIWYGRAFTDVRCHPEKLEEPLRTKKPKKIFVCPRGDLFHENVPDDFIDSVFGVMWSCLYLRRNCIDGHVFQILTKRPERMQKYLSTNRSETWARHAVHYGGGFEPDGIYDQVLYQSSEPHPRIWLGVSVEDQQIANERIPLLLKTPAALRFISAEPLLGAIDLLCLDDYGLKPKWRNEPGTYNVLEGRWIAAVNDPDFENSSVETDLTKLDWLIVGGESGKNARPMHPEWVRSLRDQCVSTGVPFFFKQWGEWAPNCLCDTKYHHKTIERPPSGLPPPYNRGVMFRCGTKRAGRTLDGVIHDAFPEIAL